MKWLFLLHQIQTPNSRERVKVWRLTRKIGTLPYRNSVYVLPHDKERLEDFQWLCQQIRDSQGEASVFVSEAKDAQENKALTQLFLAARERDYAELESKLDTWCVRFKQASDTLPASHLRTLDKELKQLEAMMKETHDIDFFEHPAGPKLAKRVREARHSLSGTELNGEAEGVVRHRTSDFKGKTWATRKEIHIDRLCSAWLIKRFIDPKAKFVFAPESKLPKQAVLFDVFGAEFSHRGDRCTFETMMESFQIKDRALSSIAELVHDIDLKDHKYNRPQADGLDMIVRALSSSFHNDHKTLEFGSVMLDALYSRLK